MISIWECKIIKYFKTNKYLSNFFHSMEPIIKYVNLFTKIE